MSRMGAQKRRKELARQEKQRAKELARAQRKIDKQTASTDAGGDVADPVAPEPAAQPTPDP